MKAADMAERGGARRHCRIDSAAWTYNLPSATRQEPAMQIGDRTVATFHYTLTDEAGTVIDSSRGREPLAYLHGAGNIVPGLEEAMEGKKVGDAFKVDVAPEDGYGLHHEGLVQDVPRDAFQGVDEIEPGMSFQAQTPQG